MEGSGKPRIATPARQAVDRFSRTLCFAFCAAVIAVLAAKLLLVGRINVNWDEFYYLSHVHALARGELDLLLQGGHTHLFRWITGMGLDEIGQIRLLRLLMWLLLAFSVWLLYRLARIWASAGAAAFAVLAYVGSWPVLKHGASFRADSLLLPLTLGAFWLIVRSTGRERLNDLAAGLCVGTAFALTTKVVLVLPALALVVALPDDRATGATAYRASHVLQRLVWMLVAAALAAGILLAGHATQVTSGAEGAAPFAARAVSATLLDVPLLPRGDYFRRLIAEDWIFWAASLAGVLLAVRRRLFRAAACMLAVLPVVFYRNAFPYYYPVMMAPATVLVALTADFMIGTRSGPARPARISAFIVLGLLLAANAGDGAMSLRFDGQRDQGRVIAAVHRIFAAPVHYIDHSGMIATFPKANFLMSGWGMESYRRAGHDFMPQVLAQSRPPLLLANHAVLQPRTLLYRQISETDRRLLETTYVDYWGPVRIAGVELALPAAGNIAACVPFAGRYRVISPFPFLFNGTVVADGEILEFEEGSEEFVASAQTAVPGQMARLVWAQAAAPPPEPPPTGPLYAPL